MNSRKKKFICLNCNYSPSSWLGKCPKCDQWNTIEEEEINQLSKQSETIHSVNLKDVKEQKVHFYKSDIEEFDSTLCGGIVKGSLVLLCGDPGVGKSTLTSTLLSHYAKKNKDETFLYISGEETQSQLAIRMKKDNIDNNNIFISNETDWGCIKKQVKHDGTKFLIIDSIQMLSSNDIQSNIGSPNMLKFLTHEILEFIKREDITCITIGHINKDGEIAGPKILEHMVDTVLYFEGEKKSNLRLLRVIKNRYGDTKEIGIFEIVGDGILRDAQREFANKEFNISKNYGTSLCLNIEGSKFIINEIQALAIENKRGARQIVANGMNTSRFMLLIAIIEKYLNIPLSNYDLYLNIRGEIKFTGRESDLAIIMSILSSFHKKPTDSKIVFCAEVGLTGEITAPKKPEKIFRKILKSTDLSIISGKVDAINDLKTYKNFEEISSLYENYF